MNFRLALLLLMLVGCTCSPGNCNGPGNGAVADPHPVVVMKTSMGDVTIELDREKAPQTVENFLKYANDHFYDGTIFHRVINGFMIQGGGFDQNLSQKLPRSPVKNESANGLKNLPGTIAMARTQDPDSATSQFFINVNANPNLDYPGNGGYTVFGKVIAGMDVVEKMKAVPTQSVVAERPRHKLENVPVTPIIIESVRLK